METYLGTIALFGFNFAPVGWLLCDGRLLSIAEYSTLFILLGTTYGGDGQNTFALPDLRGRVALGQDSTFTVGQMSGTERVTLTGQNLPPHNHPVLAVADLGNQPDPTNAFLANTDEGDNEYKAQPDPETLKPMNAGMVNPAGLGGPQPFSILQPVLGLNYCIAVEGVFPAQN